MVVVSAQSLEALSVSVPLGERMSELIPVLAETGRLQLVTGLLLAAGLWITA